MPGIRHRAIRHRAIRHRVIGHRVIGHRAIGHRAIGHRAIRLHQEMCGSATSRDARTPAIPGGETDRKRASWWTGG